MDFIDFLDNFEWLDLKLFFDFSADDSNPLKFLRDLDFENRVVFTRLSEFAFELFFDILEPFLWWYCFGVIGLDSDLFLCVLLSSFLDISDLFPSDYLSE